MESEINPRIVVPSSIEFQFLEMLVLSPATNAMLWRTAHVLDMDAVKHGRNEGFASSVLTSLLSERAIEELDDAAVAFRRRHVSNGPFPVYGIRRSGNLDLSLFGAQRYELGRRKYAKKPGEREVTFYEYDLGHVRHWQSGIAIERIELPGADLVKTETAWKLEATTGVLSDVLQLEDQTLWRKHWWEEPYLGLHVEYYFKESHVE